MQTNNLVVLDYGYLLEVNWEGDDADDQEYIQTILAMFPLQPILDWYHLSGYQGNIHFNLKEIELEKADIEGSWGDLELEEDEPEGRYLGA